MATGYKTLTIASTTTTPAEILSLDSAYPISLDGALKHWSPKQASGSRGAMEHHDRTGIGLGINGGGVGFNPEMSFGDDSAFLDGMGNLPFTPSYGLDAFSTAFDDPFSYSNDAFALPNPDTVQPGPSNAEPNTTESKEENPDNKLLSFGQPPISNYAIFTSAGIQAWPSMSAELYGMFFVAEDVFGDNLPAAGRPTELTCYRRNLFQLSGNITLNRDIKSVITEQGHQLALFDLSVTLTAVESIDGKPTDIIAIPWKSTSQTATGPAPDDRNGTAPARIPVDLTSSPELDPTVVSIPVAWKRLQFKHATANNGRRKGLQQHYVIQISLLGTLANGESVKLAEIHSGPIIVRGRSPRNFDSNRKDASSGGSLERKIEQKQKPPELGKDRDLAVKADPAVSNGSYKSYALNALQQPLDLSDWDTPLPVATTAPPLPSPSLPPDTHRAKKPSLSHSSSTITRPSVPRARWNSETSTNRPTIPQQKSSRLDLAIVDEDTSRSTSSGARSLSLGEESPRVERVGSTSAGLSGKKLLVGSPAENADLLYEYFPLSLDDWQPPVDAIYRPHVVHHTIVPPDVKAERNNSKAKRYFSADDS